VRATKLACLLTPHPYLSTSTQLIYHLNTSYFINLPAVKLFNIPPNTRKRVAASNNASNKRPRTVRGTASQPINVNASQSVSHVRTSPRRALTVAASQTTETRPFESQLRNLIPENTIVAPTDSSGATTDANTVDTPTNNDDDDVPTVIDSHIADNFNRIS
jgi:hypothetical protein